MGMSAGGGHGAKSEPNVTPYIDILLVLLIIFMVIQPFKPKAIDVKVPQKSDDVNAADLTLVTQGSVVISIDKDNKPYIQKDPVTFDTLGQKLTVIYNARDDKSVFVKGDKALTFGDVVKAIDIARGAGCEQIGIMTDLETQ